MAYATIGDIFSRYAPINTMVGTGANEVTSAEVSSVFIYDAESFINAHLAKRYVIPVTTEPLITMLTSDIAIANMMFEKLGELPNFMQTRYDRAMDMLKKLTEGDMILTASGTSLVSTGDQFAWSSTQSYHPTFSPVLDPLDQSADQEYIDAEKSARAGDIGVGS